MDEAARAFQEFERNGWNEVAEVYAALVDGAGVTQAVASSLLDGGGVTAGTAVVDVATGPGLLAAAAAARGATATGIDFAADMVRVASAAHPGVTFEVGAAESLPLDDAGADAVVSAWGMPHFADHAAFFAEVYRVLRPGGRLSLSTWCAPPKNVFFAIIV